MLAPIQQMPGSHRASTVQAQIETEAAHTPVFWNPADKLHEKGVTNSKCRKQEQNSNFQAQKFHNHYQQTVIETHSPTLEEVSKF